MLVLNVGNMQASAFPNLCKQHLSCPETNHPMQLSASWKSAWIWSHLPCPLHTNIKGRSNPFWATAGHLVLFRRHSTDGSNRKHFSHTDSPSCCRSPHTLSQPCCRISCAWPKSRTRTGRKTRASGFHIGNEGLNNGPRFWFGMLPIHHIAPCRFAFKRRWCRWVFLTFSLFLRRAFEIVSPFPDERYVIVRDTEPFSCANRTFAWHKRRGHA